jgi:hypothetical protein
MKQILLTILTTFLAFSLSNAFNVNDFKISSTKYEEAFDELSKIEDYVTHNNFTLTTLKMNNYSLVKELKLETNYSVMSTLEGTEPPLGIPSFVWGLCCGVSGLAVVYFVTDDSEQTKKALNGCLVSTAISAALTVVYYVWIFNTFY